MGDPIELRHLRYYVAVAEERSFLLASEKLHVSHAPVNWQVREMERQIGAKLITRGLHEIELTPAGHLFLDEARAVLQKATDAVDNVRAFDRGQSGRLCIGQDYTYLDEALPLAIETFRARFPAVDIEIVPMQSRSPPRNIRRRSFSKRIATYRRGLLMGHVPGSSTVSLVISAIHAS